MDVINVATYPCHEVGSVFGLSPKNTMRNSGRSSSVNDRFCSDSVEICSTDDLRFSDREKELDRLNLEVPDLILGENKPPGEEIGVSSLRCFKLRKY
jgi:hypothetical protein